MEGSSKVRMKERFSRRGARDQGGRNDGCYSQADHLGTGDSGEVTFIIKVIQIHLLDEGNQGGKVK